MGSGASKCSCRRNEKRQGTVQRFLRMGSPSVGVERDRVVEDSGGELPENPRPASRRYDLRAETTGGDHVTRSRAHVPRSRDHYLGLEDDGRDHKCAPNPAADEVAGRLGANTAGPFARM
jgi:hypothetical protein